MTGDCASFQEGYSFVSTAVVYVVGIFFDINACLWSLKYGVNAQDFDSAQAEGIERLPRILSALPLTAYMSVGFLAVISILFESDGQFTI